MRWSLLLQEYNFQLEYINGEKNHSDYLSRLNSNIYTCNKLEKPFNNLKGAENKCDERITLTDGKISSVLKFYHELTAHGGLRTMKYHIQRKYKWNKMGTDIKEYIENCSNCQKVSKNRREKYLWTVKSNAPMEVWQIDLIGPLEMSANNSRFILTIIDNYTKIALAIPLKSKSYQEVLYQLDKIINQYGSPKIIISDNGLEFRNSQAIAICNKFHITWKYSSPHHPQTNGTIE